MQERIADRVTLAPAGVGIEVRMSTKKNPFALGFLPLWWAGWTAGGVVAIMSLVFGGGSPFLVLWLVFWFLGWVFVAFAWFWMALGKEIVVVDDHRLSIRMDISGMGWTRTFLLSDITRFRAAGLFGPSDRWEYALAPWGFSGVIAFESHGKTRRFGSQLTEDQAYTLVERMKPCLPESAWRTEPRPA